MRLARPSTLWRALHLELWRLVALTAAVVVVVTAFAVTVQPLASGRLGPIDAFKFMGYASLPMLQYALPFAAGFAATLVYHRLGADNELTACFAGGISHRSMLWPAAAIGLVLSGALLVMADQVMPRFLRSMQELITRDVTQLMVASIQRGESIQFDRQRMIYADDVTPLGPDPESGAFERLVLTGVLAVRLDDQGRVVQEAASSSAFVWLFRGQRGDADVSRAGSFLGGPGVARVTDRGGGVTTVVLTLRDSVGRQERVGLAEWDDTTIVETVPNAFEDDPKYWSWGELQRLKHSPERMEWVDRRRRALAGLLAEGSVVQAVGRELAEKGHAMLADPTGRRVMLMARGVGGVGEAGGKGGGGHEDAWAILPGPSGFVEVRTREPSATTPRVQRARRAWISAPPSRERPGTALTIRLEAVESAAGDESGGALSTWVSEGLVPQADPLPGLLALSSAELITQADGTGAGERVRAAAQELRGQIGALRREILSKQQERLASAAACLVMVLCGAVMAMRMRDSLPLAVYLWSFLPALGAILSIAGGQRVTHQQGTIGLVLLWGGVAGLAAFTLVEYARLARR